VDGEGVGGRRGTMWCNTEGGRHLGGTGMEEKEINDKIKNKKDWKE